MTDQNQTVANDLIEILGKKAVIKKQDDMAAYLSDWHDCFMESQCGAATDYESGL